MKIHKKLLSIQSKIKAPKSQFNSYGKYHYRNCEDILEAVKPLLTEEKCVLFLTDDIAKVEDRYYLKVTATLTDTESGEIITVNAFAREEETKKGMDGSQVTGASSSYARKYALNGLFCIDDNKDSDATNEEEKDSAAKPTAKKETKEKTDEDKVKDVVKEVVKIAREKSAVSDAIKKEVKEILKKYDPSGNPNKIKDMKQAKTLLEEVKKVKSEE